MLLIVYSVVIFVFSSRPEVGVVQLFYGQDKVMHFVIYGIHTDFTSPGGTNGTVYGTGGTGGSCTGNGGAGVAGAVQFSWS